MFCQGMQKLQTSNISYNFYGPLNCSDIFDNTVDFLYLNYPLSRISLYLE